MSELWRDRRDRVATLEQRALVARDEQHRRRARLLRRSRHWLGQAETLAWLGVTGFVWGARVQGHRRADERMRPFRELAGAAWLVLSWRRLPGRVRRLVNEFDLAGNPTVKREAPR